MTFSVDDGNADIDYHHGQYQRPNNPSGKMKVIIKWWQSPDKIRRTWEDTKGKRIEDAITDIVVSLIVAGELQHREGAQRHYERLVGHCQTKRA